MKLMYPVGDNRYSASKKEEKGTMTCEQDKAMQRQGFLAGWSGVLDPRLSCPKQVSMVRLKYLTSQSPGEEVRGGTCRNALRSKAS